MCCTLYWVVYSPRLSNEEEQLDLSSDLCRTLLLEVDIGSVEMTRGCDSTGMLIGWLFVFADFSTCNLLKSDIMHDWFQVSILSKSWYVVCSGWGYFPNGLHFVADIKLSGIRLILKQKLIRFCFRFFNLLDDNFLLTMSWGKKLCDYNNDYSL